MRGAAQVRLEGYAVPAWTPARRRRVRERPSVPWPGDVAPEALLSGEVADVPAWIDARPRPPVAAIRFAIGAVLMLDVSLLLFRLAWG